MKTLMLKLVAIAMAVTVCTATDEAKYVCKTTGALQITAMTVTSFTPNRAHAPDKSTTCASGLSAGAGIVVISGAGTASSPYTVAEIAQTAITACGVANSGTVYTYKIIVASTANIIKKTDLLFTMTCDTASPNEVIKTTSATSVTGDPTAGTVVNDIPVAISVVTAANTATGIATTTLGTSCQLKMTLTHNGKAVKKCKITTCEAAKDSAFTTPLSLYDASGCSVSSTGVYTATTGKFTETLGANDAKYLSGPFAMFRFSDEASVYFRCKCHACLATTDPACTAPTCTVPGRRRRDVSALRNNTLASTVLLVLEGSKVTKSPVETLQQEANFTNCLNHVSFISVVAILGLLLMISLAVSVFFCSKLIRQRDQPKESYPNPAYKA